jgi:glutathione peroxidase-family protein
MECFDKLEALVKEYGDEGFMALSLAGAKMAAEADE